MDLSRSGLLQVIAADGPRLLDVLSRPLQGAGYIQSALQPASSAAMGEEIEGASVLV
jgi:hypothetical protein